MSQSKVPDLHSLFSNANDDGALSNQSLKNLNLNDIGNQIEAGLGVSVNNITSSEVILVSIMIDDSGSIRFSGNSKVVRDGHNQVIEALFASRQNHRILIHSCLLNGKILFPYIPLMVKDEDVYNKSGIVKYIPNPDVLKLDTGNYNPCLGTPLYDQTMIFLARIMAKYQEFSQNGVNARTISLIITDGADEHSRYANAKKVKSLVKDLLNEDHIISGMGIESGGYVDFRKIFSSMGVLDEWILTPGKNISDIKNAFMLFSQSAVVASQSAANFSQLSIGGFG